MFTSLLFKGSIVLLLVTACLFFAWRIVRILNPRPPRPPKYAEYFVVEVRNGATIIVTKKMGKRGSRRTKSLNLEGIASPAEGEQWFAESRDNLALFAGAKVRVQVRGLFKSDKPEEEIYMVWFEGHYDDCEVCSIEPTKEHPEPLLCEEAKARMEKTVERFCSICGGTGIDVIDAQKMVNVCMSVWCDNHLPKCDQCDTAMHTPDKNQEEFCLDFQAKWKELVTKFKDFEPYEQECLCVGTELVEDRNVVVGTVWGESGACLNLEQLKSGWAKSVGEVPEEWAEVEKEAKKAGMGIWGEPYTGYGFPIRDDIQEVMETWLGGHLYRCVKCRAVIHQYKTYFPVAAACDETKEKWLELGGSMSYEYVGKTER